MEGVSADLAYAPMNRDLAFVEAYGRLKGKLDGPTAARMWATSPLNRPHACDGKVATAEMVEQLVFLAHYGKVTLREKFPHKDARRMPGPARGDPAPDETLNEYRILIPRPRKITVD